MIFKEAPPAVAAPKAVQAEAQPAKIAARPAGEEVLIKATPIAKKIAKEQGIDLALVTGTGPGGRIVEKDVLDFIERERSAVEAKPALEASPLKRIALSDVRQVIAERMATSWQNSPMVTLNADVDCTLLKKLREDLKSSFKEKGLNLSYNYILIKACAVALNEQPMLNSYLEGNEVVLYDE
ncbi:MAG: 2-oxo acid dehydrogenase subunit E2, partial [Acetomicrobium sp.]